MATGTVQPTIVPPPPPSLETREHERVIQRQLGRTSFHVRVVDLASSVAILVVAVLLFLLAVAVVDHWIVGLGWLGRMLALALLVGGTAWYVATQIWPLVVRGINPSYAARTIEEATPSLKNSLINFLLLKRDHSGIREVVFEAVEAKAATDIASVPVEATVDRGRLIRAGYVLCGVMAVFAAYKILSPKDPFQTIARVAQPWADIARPSRVEISEVTPGDAQVYHGQVISVSALVSGVGEDDPVTLLYSTADGQTIDRPVIMALAPGGLKYEGKLPAQGSDKQASGGHEQASGGRQPPEAMRAATSTGIQQDLLYRIVAGDAETPRYRLSVVAAPTIIVDLLHYQFPPYTQKPQHSVSQQGGDIHGLEGTRVTLHAVANQPIKAAWLEFDPGVPGAKPEQSPLTADGTRARGTIVLQLDASRQAAWHSRYQVVFINERGQRSQQPIVHQIEVIRDLSPEVQILEPKRTRVQVPEDGSQTIEVRALDPDFSLSSVRLEGSAGAQPAGRDTAQKNVRVELLKQIEGQTTQVTVPYVFLPRDHKLVAGDELKLVAVAEDNRTRAEDGQPEPNVARTTEYTLVITAPDGRGGAGEGNAAGKPMPGEPMPGVGEKPAPKAGDPPPQQASGGRQPPDESAGQENAGTKPDANSQSKPKPGEQSGSPQSSGQQNSGQQNSGQPMSGQSQSGQPMPGQSQSGQPMSGQSQSGQPMSGQTQSGQPMPGGASGKSEGSSQGQDQGKGSSTQGNSNSGQAGNPQQSQPTSDSPQPGGTSAGNSTGQPSGNSNQQSGNPGDPNADASGQPSGSGQAGGQDQASGGRPSPEGDSGQGGKPSKAHEGELIEEVVKRLQQEREQDPSQGGQAGSKSPNPNPGAPQEQGNPSEQGKPEPGSAKTPQGGQQNNATNSDPGQSAAGQDPMSGQSGTKGTPPGSSGRPETAGNEPEPGKSPAGAGKSADPQNRLPDDKQGQNLSQQKSDGNEGGKPMGPDKTDQAKPASKSEGQEKRPGAGQTGDEGAGSKSSDKTGSGTGQEANRDRPKSQQPSDNNSTEGDPSPPSGSKRQSNSQGGQSGDQSGGGKKGAGQSAGQEGNDSAGSKSAADEGAGAASETGSGETGSKAGSQKEAAGKTGQSGAKAGEGSGSRAGTKGSQPGQGQPGEAGSKKPGKSDGDAPTAGSSAGGPVVNGGGDGNRPQRDYGPSAEAEAADAANLEYSRRATDLALQKLRDQEHSPDPELLDKMGWTREDLAEFLRRWDALEKSAGDTPGGKRELDEALRSLGLRDPGQKKRAGGATSDNQRDLRDSGGRSSPPAKYRDQFDAFRKGASRLSE